MIGYTKTTLLQTIKTEIPYNRIYNRLGFRKYSTELDETEKKKIDSIINSAALLVELKAVYTIFKSVIFAPQSIIIFDSKYEFQSEGFCDMMSRAVSCALFAVTAGEKIVEARDMLMKNNKMSESVIYDAVGSELAEEGAEFVHDFINKLIVRQGLVVTKRRYSPGYGDMKLENQKTIFSILQPERIGICLTPSFLMVPEKSVTAFIGIEEQL